MYEENPGIKFDPVGGEVQIFASSQTTPTPIPPRCSKMLKEGNIHHGKTNCIP
jgi:hypothetical protein